MTSNNYLRVCPYPHLDARILCTRFSQPLGSLRSPAELQQGLSLDAPSPFDPYDDGIKQAVRDLLRHGGFKPTGRSKPASEYLRQAAARGTLPSINLAVDVCNVVSLHSGLPISVIDLDLAQPPLHVAIAAPGDSYIFNASGQVMDLSGLLCLCDESGPCANAVKDSQRTKTNNATRTTLTVIWGTDKLPGRAENALQWYRQWLVDHETEEWAPVVQAAD